MATMPNFEDFQDFSKKQLEAAASASSTWAKGLQELAAESTDYSKKAFAAGSATFERLLGARSVVGRDPDSDGLRQAGLRGLRRSGEQVLRAVRQGRFGRAQAGHRGLRRPPGQVNPSTPGREGPSRPERQTEPAPCLRRRLVFLSARPICSITRGAIARGSDRLRLVPRYSSERRTGAGAALRHLRATRKFAILSFGGARASKHNARTGAKRQD
jgi:hypothetical protein